MKRILKYLMAAFFVAAGTNHILSPDWYLKAMPPRLPYPRLLVQLSGILEMALGAALLSRKLERKAAWGLVALLLAVFPANISMALRPEEFPAIKPWLLWLRLPFQFALIALVLWCAPKRAKSD